VVFCLGLRFVLDCVLSSTAICLFEDHLLRFAKDELCQTQNCIAFYLSLRFASEVLRFDLALCFAVQDHAFCLEYTAFLHAIEAIDDSPAVPEHTTPKWSRFVTIVKQQHKLDEVSYRKLFDILKQYQNEVNELRAEKLPRNSNPLALVATAQASKEIAKPITPPSETASEEDSDPEQAQRDKDMQKNLALIAKYFKKIYKPTNNNLRISLNSKNKNYDWLVNTDEEVDEQELEAHYIYMAKIKEVPTADSSTDSEPVEQVQNESGYNVFSNHLQHSAQSESVSNTCLMETNGSNVTPDSPDMCEDDIHNEQNEVESDDERVALENLIANLKLDTKQAEFEKFKAFIGRTVEYDKLERKLNEALGQLAHKDTVIREGLKTKACELSVVKEKQDELMKQSLLTKSHYEGLVQQKNEDVLDELQCLYHHKVKECDCLAQKLSKQTDSVSKKERKQYLKIQDLKAKLQDKNIAISELKKLIENGKEKSMDTKFDKPSVVRQPKAQRIPKPSVLVKPTPFSNSLDRIYFQKTRSVSKANVSEGLLKLVTAQTLPQAAKKAVSNTNVLKPGMYRIDNRTSHTRAP
nr:hypothetical protein [Tanacetum cinerariifolium]